MRIFKNFIFTLKRFKTSSILNLVGLTMAFTAIYVIVSQVHYEYTFESCHSKIDRIYRLDVKYTQSGETWPIHSRPLSDVVIHSSSHIEAGTILNPYVGEFYFTTNIDGNESGYIENVIVCEDAIAEIFDFKMIEGDAACLKDPEKILMPESMAQRIFGTTSAIGRIMKLTGNLWSKQNGGELIVGGVYQDFPNNTQLNNCIYTAIRKDYGLNQPGSSNYFCFVLLDDKSNLESVEKSINSAVDFEQYYIESSNHELKLTPFKSIYFLNEAPNSSLMKSGNPTMPLILIAIGVLIVLIVVINYMNFNLALAPKRLRSINTQKILGCTNLYLRFILISEAVLLSLFAYILAMILAYFVAKGHYMPFVLAELNPLGNIFAVSTTLLIAIITGIIAGIRPAIYITSFTPAVAIKGSVNGNKSGFSKKVLIGTQFLISIVLIISTTFIYLQNRYVLKYNLGYETEQIAIVDLSQKLSRELNSYINQLKENPDILDVAACSEHFGASDGYRTWGVDYKGDNITFYSIGISHNFLDVMGIKAIDGRVFSEADIDGVPTFVINRTAHEKYGIAVGDDLKVGWRGDDDQNRVIGIVDNVKFRSLRNEGGNLLFTIQDPKSDINTVSYIKIKAGADIPKTVKYIEDTVRKIDSTYPTEVTFYDEVFDNLYKRELNTQSIIGLFSILAILLSISGVFGLVMFECEQRQKEISIRKVLGSTIGEVLALFNKIYVRILIFSFVVAVPISYFAINKWLENFAYKTPVYWWVFLVSGLIIAAIVVLIVSLQSYKAATTNPVKSLKNE